MCPPSRGGACLSPTSRGAPLIDYGDPMRTRFAINGLGRIGRALVRVAREHPAIELVAANDQADPVAIARLLRHDPIHGRFPGTGEVDPAGLTIDGRPLRLFRHSVPGDIPWNETPGGAPQVV